MGSGRVTIPVRHKEKRDGLAKEVSGCECIQVAMPYINHILIACYYIIPVFCCMVIDHTEGVRLLKIASRLALMERRESRAKSEYVPAADYRS